MGQIITFYSYKGGVGRSMALANIAVLLAQWKYHVLIVDWDLEAPGIENYFKGFNGLEDIGQKKGIIDFITSFERDGTQPLSWREHLTTIHHADGYSLDLLTAGERGEQYFQHVRELDVSKFYSEKKGGNFVESLRNEWKDTYDYILVDSRTGITDIGGICTIQLPDILMLFATPTKQALDGVIEVTQKAIIARQKLPVDRLRLLAVPILSRFDTQTEFKISREWLECFVTGVADIYADWLPTGITN
ncbi:predicted protein [Candidatus Moduliflexus flocculans]|uniref:CobQ/CobB/MinD/ParA nucleotide binding domain-containing protein n=1 Tax=Candidatus Moduliflexus flocculans TaxID=1499966 RepID=A0A0S6VZZ4_9BACT|nr:predicted protein [Candidatus Moduliflexus flocculans]